MTSTNGLSDILIQIHPHTPSTNRLHHHMTSVSKFSACNQNVRSEDKAWAHWRKLNQPKLIVAPMYDASELPFRMLCRNYGAEAAYTPMIHSRTFVQSKRFRSTEFTTCKVHHMFCFFYDI